MNSNLDLEPDLLGVLDMEMGQTSNRQMSDWRQVRCSVTVVPVCVCSIVHVDAVLL